ncbi:MAG: helix-turn-helix domain-containing protein [Anaerolineales bacterium]|nr:helix-turn-helix domain-containing protein [Anaerolineales bacterium]MCB8951183.1 helix-turn-helix domain-containing protein [Ardenticatenales bacterium]
MNRAEFGKLIKVLRESQKDENDRQLTQQKLAESTGLSEAVVRNIETGRKANLQLEDLHRLAQTFQLTTLERHKFFTAAAEIDKKRTVAVSPQQTLQDVVARLTDVRFPAYIVDAYHDIVAANSIMINVFGIPVDLEDAATHPIALNGMRTLFDPEFCALDLIGTNVEHVLLEAVLFFRYSTLPYRGTDYYVYLLKNLNKYKKFKDFWYRVLVFTPDYAVPVHVRHTVNTRHGRLKYVMTVTEVPTAETELMVINCLPVDVQTAQVFERIAAAAGVKWPFLLATWPEKRFKL